MKTLWGENNRSSRIGVSKLLKSIRDLMADPTVRCLVEDKMREFLEMRGRADKDWFRELAFCLLTANSSAESALKALEELGGVIYQGSIEEVEVALRRSGYRFPRRRAEYIVEARKLLSRLKKIVEGFNEVSEARRWLAENVRGLGWKEASHFLRNTGHLDMAILDRHILRVMARVGLIDERSASKTPMGSHYENIEGSLREVAKRLGIPLGILDLYLWYMETGKVLK